MSDHLRIFYESSNGDRWALGRREGADIPYVFHMANAPSGGARTQIEIGSFLARGPSGPEHQALLKLFGTLVPEATDFMQA